MSEHAFDPIPDEQQETATLTPNAIVTDAQVEEAIASGRWSHDVPGTALWLNTSFPPVGERDALVATLAAHGVVVV